MPRPVRITKRERPTQPMDLRQMTSASKTFAIPELFELILLNLDTRTLLTKAQLICHTWTSFIQESPAIQWALFFKPEPIGSPWQNPLLAEVFPSIFTSDPDVQSNVNLTFTNFDLILNSHKFDAYMRPEASWRRMLVQQPPLSTLSLLRSSAGHGGQLFYHYEALVSDISSLTAIDLPSGLRMETVFETLIFSEMWEQFDYQQATEAIWGPEQLAKMVRTDLERYGVENFGLMIFTSVGWSRHGLVGSSLDWECAIVKKVKEGYQKLGLKPKVTAQAFVKRKSYGSLWD
ncbi:unnamed protein product [Penicillium salamii]|uniref:F-box domain-containing protein n=1 Tax=Penicillium salamii TaxID=1612424 RepID=A0A9W4J799_9EURO|nr:unnamed protein product [Penicillium salamii]